MAELLSGIDLKTFLLVVALGGSNVGQYFGISAPAQAQAETSVHYTAEAQSRVTDQMEQIAKLQRMLADCQEALLFEEVSEGNHDPDGSE